MHSPLEALAIQPCVRNAPRLADAAIGEAIAHLPGWAHVADRIAKTSRFANYHETVAFVNAVAWIAHRKPWALGRTAGALDSVDSSIEPAHDH